MQSRLQTPSGQRFVSSGCSESASANSCAVSSAFSLIAFMLQLQFSVIGIAFCCRCVMRFFRHFSFFGCKILCVLFHRVASPLPHCREAAAKSVLGRSGNSFVIRRNHQNSSQFVYLNVWVRYEPNSRDHTNITSMHHTRRKHRSHKPHNGTNITINT